MYVKSSINTQTDHVNSIPSVAKTEGALSTEFADVTFTNLTENQTFTLGGVTIVAGSGGVTGANLAAAFASKAALATIAAPGGTTTGNHFTVY